MKYICILRHDSEKLGGGARPASQNRLLRLSLPYWFMIWPKVHYPIIKGTDPYIQTLCQTCL